jgi:hypothetical protein
MGDKDFGTAGVLLLPEGFTVSGSKAGTLYLNAIGNLGRLRSTDNAQIAQTIALGGELHGAAVAWTLPGGSLVYAWAANDALRVYQLVQGQLVQRQTGPMALGMGQPGGILSLSADGEREGTAVLWVAQPADGAPDANQLTVPGILQAFDALDATSAIWDSHMTAGDDCGNFAKFAPPTVFDGRVYLPSFSHQVCVYSLR